MSSFLQDLYHTVYWSLWLSSTSSHLQDVSNTGNFVQRTHASTIRALRVFNTLFETKNSYYAFLSQTGRDFHKQYQANLQAASNAYFGKSLACLFIQSNHFITLEYTNHPMHAINITQKLQKNFDKAIIKSKAESVPLTKQNGVNRCRTSIQYHWVL